MTVLAIAVGAAIGGFLRFWIEYKFPPVGRNAFPVGTFFVNIAGAFICGLVVTAPDFWHDALGVGFCGALTTFSGVSLQIARRFRAKAIQSAGLYLVILLGAGLVSAWAGMQIGQAFTW